MRSGCGLRSRGTAYVGGRMRCDQCEALMINGVFCHESGCPNTHARWDHFESEWIPQRKCFECGTWVDADEQCCDVEVA